MRSEKWALRSEEMATKTVKQCSVVFIFLDPSKSNRPQNHIQMSYEDRDDEHDHRVARDIIGDFENEFREGFQNAKAPDAITEEIMEQQKQEDIELLQKAWIREKTAPDIFPYEEDLIERMLERIRRQLEFIEINSVELQTQEKDIKLILVIIESELERVQFMIRSYVRLRLRKIDMYALYIQEHPEVREKLNADERTYMEGHLAMLHTLFEEQFLRKLPGSANTNLGEDTEMVVAPDTAKPVVVAAGANTFVAPWKRVAQRVSRGELELV